VAGPASLYAAPTGEPAAPTCAPFQNEAHADFTREANRKAMAKAIATIGASAGRDYPLLIDGSPLQTGRWLDSVNPAHPSQVVGRVASAGAAEADHALDSAVGAFHFWRDTPAAERADVLLKAAAGMRAQRFELAALEVLEAGKPWREADADVCEAIDFLECYAREALRLSQIWQLSDVPARATSTSTSPGVWRWSSPRGTPAGHPHRDGVRRTGGRQQRGVQAGHGDAILGYAMVRILHEAGIPGGRSASSPARAARSAITFRPIPVWT